MFGGSKLGNNIEDIYKDNLRTRTLLHFITQA